MFSEVRFDLGTLDSGERSLPFGLLVFSLKPETHIHFFWPYAYWEKGKTMDFSETIVVYDLKLATDDRSDKKFLLTSKICPLRAVCPLPWSYIHVKNQEKNCIKSDFKEISLKLATNG